jgi:hypothetical protein
MRQFYYEGKYAETRAIFQSFSVLVKSNYYVEFQSNYTHHHKPTTALWVICARNDDDAIFLL